MKQNIIKNKILDIGNFIALEQNVYLNKTTGGISNEIQPDFSTIINEEVTIITGIDKQKINLRLVSGNSKISPINGFLVEVYVSGSDGKLTRLYQKDDLDENGDIRNEGFEQYFLMDLK